MTMHFSPGCVLEFFGHDYVSRGIEVVTGRPTLRFPFWELGPSHVALVADDPNYRDGVLALWESTTLCPLADEITGTVKTGVQVHRIMERIKAYPGSIRSINLVPSWKITTSERRLLTEFLLHHHREGYDYRNAGLSGTRVYKLLRHVYPNPQAVFCSEFIALALQRIGRMCITNPAVYNPANLVRSLRASGVYSKPVWIKR